YYSYALHRDLHSFPTRRSSDLRTFTASSFKQVDIDSGNESKLFDFNYNITGTHVWSRNLNKIVFLQADNESSPESRFTSLYIMKDRKSTRLNSSHVSISYAVFC